MPAETEKKIHTGVAERKKEDAMEAEWKELTVDKPRGHSHIRTAGDEVQVNRHVFICPWQVQSLLNR